jgi:hypothetical protein
VAAGVRVGFAATVAGGSAVGAGAVGEAEASGAGATSVEPGASVEAGASVAAGVTVATAAVGAGVTTPGMAEQPESSSNSAIAAPDIFRRLSIYHLSSQQYSIYTDARRPCRWSVIHPGRKAACSTISPILLRTRLLTIRGTRPRFPVYITAVEYRDSDEEDGCGEAFGWLRLN